MKILFWTVLLFLTGCGAYAGTDGVYLFPDGLPQEAIDAGQELVSEEGIMAGIKGIFGSFTAYLLPTFGIGSILISAFVTKRKKKGN